MPETIFDIVATWDGEAGVWVGICDALPVATEAATLEGLHALIGEIGPEIAVLNGHDPARFRIVTEPVPLVAAE